MENKISFEQIHANAAAIDIGRSGLTKTMSPFDSAQGDIVFVRHLWPFLLS